MEPTTSLEIWDVNFGMELPIADVLSNEKVMLSAPQLETHGYKFWIETRKVQGEHVDYITCYLRSKPNEGCDGYSLLTNYRITLTDDAGKEWMSMLVECDLISNGVVDPDPFWLVIDVCALSNSQRLFTINLSLRIKEMLTGKSENLQEESPYRDFALLVANNVFYVDVNYLADLGSPLFDEWLQCRKKGLKRTVLLSWDADDLCKFMDAVCTYRAPVITCRNFDFILAQASEHRVAKVLRACERFLSESTTVHPIRKLEIAAEHSLGMLGDCVLSNMGSGIEALESLHEYCNQNKETIDLMHPDVLEALEIHENFVVL